MNKTFHYIERKHYFSMAKDKVVCFVDILDFLFMFPRNYILQNNQLKLRKPSSFCNSFTTPNTVSISHFHFFGDFTFIVSLVLFSNMFSQVWTQQGRCSKRLTHLTAWIPRTPCLLRLYTPTLTVRIQQTLT